MEGASLFMLERKLNFVGRSIFLSEDDGEGGLDMLDFPDIFRLESIFLTTVSIRIISVKSRIDSPLSLFCKAYSWALLIIFGLLG
jgi:hypothetical protein